MKGEVLEVQQFIPIDGEKFKLPKPPTVIGGYRLAESENETSFVQFNLCYRPKWLHRKCMKIFFGWTWHDIKN